MGMLRTIKKYAKTGINTFTGKRQSDIAKEEQKRRMGEALAEYNVYSDGKYYDDDGGLSDGTSQRKSFNDMQRAIIDEQATGKSAAVSGYDRTTATPMQNLYNASIQGNMNRAIGGPIGGTASRGVNRTISQGMTNANNEMYSKAQDMAGTTKQSALANLQAASAGRSNVYQGMASNVQADPSIMSRFNSGMNTYKNIAGATSKS